MPQESVIECPFCHKETIRILNRPCIVNVTRSTCRAGGHNRRIQRESHEVLSGCPECGKSQKEVEKVLDEGVVKPISHDERLKRLKEVGLPTRIETKRRD